MFIIFIGYIVSPVIAAFLAGKLGDSKKEAFLGWFTAVMISTAIVVVGYFIQIVISAVSLPIEMIISSLMELIGVGVIYALLYAFIPLLIAD